MIIQCYSSVNVMDDWKLKATPVVRLKRSSKTFVYLPVLYFSDLVANAIHPSVNG